MKTTASLIRIVILVLISVWVLEYAADSKDGWAFIEKPILWVILAVIVLLILAAEIAVEALKTVMFKSLNPEAQQRYLDAKIAKQEKRFGWWRRLYEKLTDSHSLEEEDEIVLDHNYDGIKELDNNLPPWWVYLFYVTIVFGAIYLARYHVFGGNDQAAEYEEAVAQANIEIEEYKRTAKNLVDVNTVEVLTEAADLSAGKNIFTQNCIACHKDDGGGGIGPNLTDEYWVLGGGIKNVFRTISEGGRDGKGMVAWKQTLKPLEMAQVASYVLQFQGTTPAEPKAAEGELWVDPNAEVKQEKVQDSIPTEVVNDSIPSGIMNDSIPTNVVKDSIISNN